MSCGKKKCVFGCERVCVQLFNDAHPSPGDLAAFLPWACDQLTVDIDLVISKKIVEELAEKPKATKQKSTFDIALKQSHTPDSPSIVFAFNPNPSMAPTLLLQITYDQYDRVTGLQFQNKIPRKLMQIIGLITNFHKNLTSIAIKQGLDAEVLYELKKVILLSKITMVNIDNCFVAQGNYYILLDISCLKNMSLTRCKINDEVVGMIAERLKYQTPRSLDLVALSLSNNLIGDVGAKSISDALRVNVKLTYLNLAGNRISDTGALGILHSLAEFALTPEEVATSRRRNSEYVSNRNALVKEILKENARTKEEQRSGKKTMKMNLVPTTSGRKERKGLASETSKHAIETADAFTGPDSYDKALIWANKLLGPSTDPLSIRNTVFRDGEFFYPGNSTLCYLNLAYNDLTYHSLKKLHEVLLYQRETFKKPAGGGLINVWLEGNPMPLHCKELDEIDLILDKGLSTVATSKKSDKKFGRKSGF